MASIAVEVMSPPRVGVEMPCAPTAQTPTPGQGREGGKVMPGTELPGLQRAFRQTKCVTRYPEAKHFGAGDAKTPEQAVKRARGDENDDPAKEQSSKSAKTCSTDGEPAETEASGVSVPSLPKSLQNLVSIYDGLLVAQALLMSRTETCTFDKLKEPAEVHCGHRIEVTHLQQIKHIYPEALQWSWVNAQPGQVGEGIRNGRILKVALGPATEANAASIEPAGVCMRRHKPAMQSGFLIASVSELRRILLAAVSSGKGDGDDFKAELLGLAPLPADPLQRNGTQNDPTLPRSILKTDSSVSEMALDEADLGGRMRKSSHDKRVRFGPVTHRIIPARQRGNGTPPARTLRVVESDSEDEDLETLACMGLMCPPEPSEVFGLETLASVSDCADDLLGDPSNTGKVDVAAEAFYTHDADGDLPISLEALETITCWEAEDAARDEESEATKAAEAKAVAMLPRTFDMLQSIFGLHGPCAMPRDKVVSKLKTTCSARTPVSHEEVDAMLVALADAAPRYLRLLSAEETSNHVPMVRISRHVEIMGLKKDLRTRADAAASLR